MKIGKKLLKTALLLALGVLTAGEAGAEGRKLLALTFDDGPSPYTGALLDGLASRGARVTFFMTGVNGQSGIENHPELLERMWREGHQLGNHTYRHTVLAGASPETVEEELARVETLIRRALGGPGMVMLRPPCGLADEALRRRAAGPLIQWSVDPLDWKIHSEERIVRAIVENAADGAIVLLHDIYEPSVRAALRAVDALGDEYEFVTVAELLRRRGAAWEDGDSCRRVEGEADLPPYRPPAIILSKDENGGFRVEIVSPDGLPVRYTLDGRYPDLGDPVASGPIFAAEGATVTAVGVDGFCTRSPAAVTSLKTFQGG